MKVIIAIDQTDFAKQIIEAVSKRHWPIDTEFKVLTVVEPLQWDAVPCMEWNQFAEQALEKRKHYAHELVMDAKHKISAAVPNCSVHVDTRHGSPRDQIVTAATEWMADKIILGAHGHAPNRLLGGSVSRSVAQHAICSVELIRVKNLPKQDSEVKAKSAAVAKK